jgi:integrase
MILMKTSLITFSKQKKSRRVDKIGGLSNSYVKTMAIIINSAINYAVENDFRVPLKAKIQKPQVDRKEVNVLSPKVQKQLEDTLIYDNSKTTLGILIALKVGLRIGEICALRWEDIDLKNKIIKVQKSVVRVSNTSSDSQKTKYILAEPKTKTSIRDIPINTKLYSILVNADDKNGYVISNTSEFICPITFEYRFHKKLAEHSNCGYKFSYFKALLCYPLCRKKC